MQKSPLEIAMSDTSDAASDDILLQHIYVRRSNRTKQAMTPSRSLNGPSADCASPHASSSSSRTNSFDKDRANDSSQDLMIFPEDVEPDDWLHSPDKSWKPTPYISSGRALKNFGGLLLVGCGVLLLFIGYPILYAVFEAFWVEAFYAKH